MEYYSEYGAIGVFIGLFVYGYFKQSKRADEQATSLEDLRIENKVNNIEEKLDTAMVTIEELMEKHIEEENKRYEQAQVDMDQMQEEIKWYQKNVSINPLSWKKKNKNK